MISFDSMLFRHYTAQMFEIKIFFFTISVFSCLLDWLVVGMSGKVLLYKTQTRSATDFCPFGDPRYVYMHGLCISYSMNLNVFQKKYVNSCK